MSGLSRAIVEAARQDGQDLSDILKTFDVDRSVLDRADAYVPIEMHEMLWAEGARRTGRPDFGIYVAERFNPGLTGVVEYILRNCTTVREGAEAWLRLAPLVSDRISGALETEGPTVRLYWRLDRPLCEGNRHWTAFAQGRTLHMIREAMGLAELAPKEVWFRHDAPEDTTRYRAFFRTSLVFGQPENALVWPTTWLSAPLKGVDSAMRAALETRAEALRQEISETGTLKEACAHAIRRLLAEPAADARLERVAEHLQLSPRTLQRKLRKEDVSFQEVLDDVRRVEAEALIKTLTHQQVAERLGFSDDAALRKAQRRWALKAKARISESDP